MELINLREEKVEKILNDFFNEGEGTYCRCEKCRLNVMAITLNNLKPGYVVSEKVKL